MARLLLDTIWRRRPQAARRASPVLVRALCLAFAALALAGPASSAQPAKVYHSTTGSDPGLPFVVDGSEPLQLYLSIGSVPSNVPSETLCIDGSGDEICGFTLVLVATGDLRFDAFCQTSCADDLVHYIDATGQRLAINHVGPAIDDALSPFFIGDVAVSVVAPGSGEILIDPTSQAAAANLGLVSLTGGVPLPEPTTGMGLAIGAIALLAAARRARPAEHARGEPASSRSPRVRRTRCRSVLVAILLAGPLAGLLDAAPSGAGVFTDEASFIADLGGTPSRVGFETVPLTSAGFAAATNGDRIGQITLSSSTLAADLDLAWLPGSPLGLLGTMLVADPLGTGDPALWPGGTAAGSGLRQDDDLRIEFDDPVRAAGLTILENVDQVGETVTFFDVYDQPIASFELPGGATPPGADGFIGYVIEPGDAPIAVILIDEQAILSDDIGIDEILYDRGADPFADAVTLFSPTILGGQPTGPNLDPDQSLGPPDATTVSLGNAGKLFVEFVDNTLTGSGDALPDLRIYEDGAGVEGGAFQEGGLVSISANGSLWQDVGSFAGGVSEIDLDAFGFDQDDVFRFVRLIDDPAQGATAGPTVGADIDAVEALSGQLLPPDGDDDHVPDSYDDCVSDYDASQADDDADGVGNACDNCRRVFNPGQVDSDADGQGNACEPARVRLIRDFNPTLDETKFPLADLRLDCGGTPISTLMVGIWIPPLALDITFGDACQAPPATPEFPGAPTGSGCSAGNVGPSVAPGLSGVFGNPLASPPVPPAQTPPAGFRSDVIWVLLQGSAANGGLLCSPGQTGLALGRIKAGSIPSPAMGGLQGGVVSFSLEDQLAALWRLGDDENDLEIDPELIVYANESPLPAVAELLLQSAGPPSGPLATEWDICIADTTDPFMHRVTMGLLGPETADADSLFLDGCRDVPVPPEPLDERPCSAVAPNPLWVDDTQTFTLGPLATASGTTLLEETLYTPIEGGAFGLAGIGVLNPFLSAANHCVGRVTNSSGTVGAPPIPIRNGFDEIAASLFADSPSSPYQTVVMAQEQDLSGELVYETIAFNLVGDIDADGLTDPLDNCPFEANPDQADVGGFELAAPPDGRGDACQCGDANESGVVVGSQIEPGPNGDLDPDLLLIRQYLVGMHAANPHIPKICSVNGDSDCDVADAVVLERAFSVPGVEIEQRCDAAVD